MRWSHIIIKIGFFTAVIYLMAYLLPTVASMGLQQVLFTALFLVGVAYLTDIYLLPKVGSIYAALIDGGTMVILLYGLQFLVPGMSVSLTWALMVGILLGSFEFFFHPFIAENEKTL